jgi:DNA-binding NtrC family response regulator
LPKILVIDDNPQMRRVMSRTLQMEGHDVVLAEDGLDGIAKYRAELPDLVITDMIMPRQGGIETIVKIHEENPDARIIAVSGGGTIDGTHPLLAAVMHGEVVVLRKPFMRNELIGCVARALGYPRGEDNQHAPAE